MPWDEAWVHRFLVEIPKRMHWNAFRLCIGPPPQHWLDMADENGLLLQYEYPVWDDREPLRHKTWSEDEVLTQFKEFVRDNWNHPSVVLWDASNETNWPFLGDKVIPTVRKMDLSDRPWENSYNGPQAANDPYEAHPYKFITYVSSSWGDTSPLFHMTDLENGTGYKPEWPGHAAINNEYDWLWLHRDGTPTFISKPVYDDLAGPHATPDQRFFLNSYLLAGLTEHWRASRVFAGVMYLAYLDAEGPHIVTNDNFKDVRTLEFQSYFEEFMGQAFKPLGVDLVFWHPTLQAGSKRTFRIVLTNDTEDRLTGKLDLALSPWRRGAAQARSDTGFDVPAWGQETYEVELAVPASATGEFELRASAGCGKPWCPTLSRRNVMVVP